MGSFRTPGPVCSIRDGGDDAPSPFGPPLPSASYSQPGSVGQSKLTPEQEELALDIVQLSLDVVGIFEPTPFADGSNALISLGRGDWLGAGLSTISIVPYLGDLAKAGKLPKYARSLQKAVDLAKTDAVFARYLRPALKKLKELLDSIPTESLSSSVQAGLESLRRPIDAFLGGFTGSQRVWWKVLDESPKKIPGTSIPEWMHLRVSNQEFRLERNAAKLDQFGKPIGPSTKHLAEKGIKDPARDWARMGGKQGLVDFPMSALAGGLEEATKLIKSGRAQPGQMITVEAWEFGINTSKKPWVVFHAKYDPNL